MASRRATTEPPGLRHGNNINARCKNVSLIFIYSPSTSDEVVKSSVKNIPWLAKALISASALSADWLGSNGAAQDAHVDGKASKVVDFDRQYCSSILHLFNSYKGIRMYGYRMTLF